MEDASLDDFLDTDESDGEGSDDGSGVAGASGEATLPEESDAGQQSADSNEGDSVGDGEASSTNVDDETQSTDADDDDQPTDETADDTSQSGEVDDAAQPGAAGDSVAVDPDGVEPATTTYAWAGDGAACEACGTVVDRRWDDDGRLVCPDCKEW